MAHFVLFVDSEKELAIRDELIKRGFTAKVPRENRLIRFGGVWICKEYTLFTSYVFVEMLEVSNNDYYEITAVPNVRRFLGVKSPESISEQEAIHIGLLTPNLEPIQPSVVKFDEYGTPRIVSGVLTQMPIVSVDKHRRRAKVLIGTQSIPKHIELSFYVSSDKEL